MSERLENARALLLPIFRSGLDAKIGVLSRALAAARRGDPEAATTLRALAHQVRGTGASYGLPCVSVAGALVEDSRPEDLDGATLALIGVLRDSRNETASPPLSVLLADEDAALGALLVRALSGEVIVLPAQDADTARSYLESLTFDCVLLGLGIGSPADRALFEEVARAPLRRERPIIALSSRDSEALRSECLALGAALFMAKPVTPDDVGAAIAMICAKQRGPRAAEPPGEVRGATRATARPRILLLSGDAALADALGSDRVEVYDVVHCLDAEAALERADAERFALLLLDCSAGPLGGFGALERLRAHPRHRHAPILMLTALGDDEQVERAFALGADDCLEKPLDLRAFEARTRPLLVRASALARVRDALCW